mgnify:CR=1 FL=1
MSITLLQPNSFLFDERACFNKFRIEDRPGIECVLDCINQKLLRPTELQHHVLFLKGRTGSGKSTCLPSRLFEQLDRTKTGPRVVVNVTEPRVILAKSIPVQNCEYSDYLKFGINTGYHTGAGRTDITSPSRLVYMTTEIFKIKLTHGGWLGNVVMVDECHDMDIPMMTLLRLIKEYLSDTSIPIENKPLFIFASATLNLDLMIEYYFGSRSILSNTAQRKLTIDDIYKDALMINHILGTRNYPVDERYMPDECVKEYQHNDRKFVDFIVNEAVEESIKSKETWKGLPARDILIFTYGVRFAQLFQHLRGVQVDQQSQQYGRDGRDNNRHDDRHNGKHHGKHHGKHGDRHRGGMSGGELEIDVDDVYSNYGLIGGDDMSDTSSSTESDELDEIEHEIDEVETYLDDIASSDTLTGGLSKYPIYVSTMTQDDTEAVWKWRNANKGKFRILILPYGATCRGFAKRLLEYDHDPDPDSQQYEIKIYITTNAVETGKTVNTWYQVYDTGLRASKFYTPIIFNPEHPASKLIRHPITQSASTQRCGRVGRTCPGISWRVFSKEAYEAMEKNALPENINMLSMAEMILACRPAKMTHIDLVKNNEYIKPNSFDTNLVSARDLVESGFCTPWGELITDVRDYREPVNTWVLKAEEIYYSTDAPLMDTLMLCRFNRQNINQMLSCPMPQFAPMVVELSEVSEQVVQAIYEAHSEYIKFKVGYTHIFKRIVH